MADLANVAAEQAVLGACLLDDDKIPAVRGVLGPADFWRGSHRTIFETVSALHTRRQPVDLVSVGDELERTGHLEAAGGMVALGDLLGATATPTTALHHAQIVAGLARRRRVQAAAHDLAAKAADQSVDVDAAVADTTDRLAEGHQAGLTVEGLADEALAHVGAADAMFGWGAPWHNLADWWRIVPGWVHLVIGWPSAGKSALVDSLMVGLAEQHGVRGLLWSPEGAPSARHMLRLANIHADRHLDLPEDAVQPLSWVEQHFSWLDHDQRTTVPDILAAADAWAHKHRLDVLVIDPFTSIDKWDSDPGEPWDRMLNRHLSRIHRWARSRNVAVVLVAHPKQRDRRPDGTQPVCTSSDIAGGQMWGNQVDSLASVWRDPQGVGRDASLTDVHVQKVRENGPGGEMGRMSQLVRLVSGRYQPASNLPAGVM